MARRPGRPSKIDDHALRERMLDAVRAGCTRMVATGNAGVDDSTVRRWLQRGERDQLEGIDSLHARFLFDIKEAEAEAVAQATFAVRRGMLTDWRAALEFLKRRCPQDWSERVEIHSKRQAAELRAELSADEQKALAMALLVD